MSTTATHLRDLTLDEERDLIRQAQAQNAQALDTLLRLSRPTIIASARRTGARHADVDDLIQEALLAVADVVTTYDLDRPGRLVTAITPRVRRAITDTLATTRPAAASVPARTMSRFLGQVRSADGDLGKAHAAAVAKAAETGDRRGVDDFFAIAAAVLPVAAGVDFMDPTAQPDAVIDRVFVEEVLAVLDDRERTVLRAHFGLDGEPETDAAIAKTLGVDRSRVVRIRQRALDKVRESVHGMEE